MNPALAAALGQTLDLDRAAPLAPDALAGLAPAIAAAIKQALPDLAECKAVAGRFDLAALKEASIKAPAVLVSLLSWRARQADAGVARFAGQIACFIITKDRLGAPRDAAALVIAQAVTALADANRWGLAWCGQAENLTAETLVSSATRGAAASLAVVTWTQPFTLSGPPAYALMSELYLGLSPETGPAHVADYIRIGADA
jgi:hypothetical protein